MCTGVLANNSVWFQQEVHALVTVDRPQLPQCLQCLVVCEGLSQSHSTIWSNLVPVKTAVGDTHSVFRAVYSVLIYTSPLDSAVSMIEMCMCNALLIINTALIGHQSINNTQQDAIASLPLTT